MGMFIELGVVQLIFSALAGLLWLTNHRSEGAGTPNPLSFENHPSESHYSSLAGRGTEDTEWMSFSASWQGNEFDINPANGLPMIGGYAGFDIAGNTFGFDSTHDYSSSGFDDSFSSSRDGFSSSDFDSCSGFSSSDSGSCGGFSEW